MILTVSMHKYITMCSIFRTILEIERLLNKYSFIKNHINILIFIKIKSIQLILKNSAPIFFKLLLRRPQNKLR